MDIGLVGVLGVGVLAVIIVFYVISFYSSASSKVVVVKEKWVKYHGEDAKYLFSDMQNNVYSIEDSLLLLVFDASDRYAKLNNSQYTIRTYGWRIRILSWYPNAIEIE